MHWKPSSIVVWGVGREEPGHLTVYISSHSLSLPCCYTITFPSPQGLVPSIIISKFLHVLHYERVVIFFTQGNTLSIWIYHAGDGEMGSIIDMIEFRISSEVVVPGEGEVNCTINGTTFIVSLTVEVSCAAGFSKETDCEQRIEDCCSGINCSGNDNCTTFIGSSSEDTTSIESSSEDTTSIGSSSEDTTEDSRK